MFRTFGADPRYGSDGGGAVERGRESMRYKAALDRRLSPCPGVSCSGFPGCVQRAAAMSLNAHAASPWAVTRALLLFASSAAAPSPSVLTSMAADAEAVAWALAPRRLVHAAHRAVLALERHQPANSPAISRLRAVLDLEARLQRAQRQRRRRQRCGSDRCGGAVQQLADVGADLRGAVHVASGAAGSARESERFEAAAALALLAVHTRTRLLARDCRRDHPSHEDLQHDLSSRSELRSGSRISGEAAFCAQVVFSRDVFRPLRCLRDPGTSRLVAADRGGREDGEGRGDASGGSVRDVVCGAAVSTLLEDESARVRCRAAVAATEWALLLHHSSSSASSRDDVDGDLDVDLLGALVDLVSDGSEAVRVSALHGLCRLGSEQRIRTVRDRAHRQALLLVLEDRSNAVRHAAHRLLRAAFVANTHTSSSSSAREDAGEIGSAVGEVVDALLRNLRRYGAADRGSIMTTMRAIGRHCGPVVLATVRRALRLDPFVRFRQPPPRLDDPYYVALLASAHAAASSPSLSLTSASDESFTSASSTATGVSDRLEVAIGPWWRGSVRADRAALIAHHPQWFGDRRHRGDRDDRSHPDGRGDDVRVRWERLRVEGDVEGGGGCGDVRRVYVPVSARPVVLEGVWSELRGPPVWTTLLAVRVRCCPDRLDAVASPPDCYFRVPSAAVSGTTVRHTLSIPSHLARHRCTVALGLHPSTPSSSTSTPSSSASTPLEWTALSDEYVVLPDPRGARR